jgi:hypothetical protein
MRAPTRGPAGWWAAAGDWGREHPAMAARRGAYLGTRYPDGAVAAMADEDGQGRFSTGEWGPANRTLYGLWAVMQAAITHMVAVRLWLDGALARVAGAYARARPRFESRREEAATAQAAVAQAIARHSAMIIKLADRGLDPPAPAWRVLAFLGLLATGDLTMTSVAMMVLNISDRPYVAWLPVSALMVAAVPVVVGLLAAAHFLGESIKAYRCEQRLRAVNLLIGLASLAGGLFLGFSVADIRASYLAATGLPSLFWPFVGIQLGFFAVAVAASTWAAHPYRAEWRQASRGLRRATARYLRRRRSAARLAGRINRLTARHRGLVARAAASAAAARSDGARQGHLYLRGHQHGLPEPVTGELHPGPVPAPELPGPVQELQGYPDVPPGSYLAPLTPVDLDDLDGAWERLLHDMQDRAAGWPAREPAPRQMALVPVNGSAPAHYRPRRTAPSAHDDNGPGPGAA